MKEFMVEVSKKSMMALSAKSAISIITAREICPKNFKIDVGHFLCPSWPYLNEKSKGFSLIDLALNALYVSMYRRVYVTKSKHKTSIIKKRLDLSGRNLACKERLIYK